MSVILSSDRNQTVTSPVLLKMLRDSHPHSRDCIDLSNVLKGQGHFVHMPEYAHAVGIPAKPMASKAIGKAVEHGQWDEVREQVLADVFTAAIIANRHLISAARVSGDVDASDATIFSELAAACPWSKWLNLQTRGWDLHREDRRVLLIRWRHDSHQNHPPELCLEGPKLL